jgi:hypothetical protein
VLDHVLDGSRFERWTGPVDAGTTAGWGAVGGLAVAVLGRDGEGAGDPVVIGRFLEEAQGGAVPLLRIAVTGTSASFTLSDPGRLDFAFSWPAAEGDTDAADGAIDPRDSRFVLAIARWCLAPR